MPIITAHMRTIGFRSNILFAIAAAIGIIIALGRPWYGAAPAKSDAQIEELFNSIARAFTGAGGQTGWQVLQSADTLLAGLALATAGLLVLTLVPFLQTLAQALARWTALAALGVVLVKFVDEPGANAAVEPRFGLLIALGAALVLVLSTMTVASAPARRRVPSKSYSAPAAPEPLPETSWGPPQF